MSRAGVDLPERETIFATLVDARVGLEELRAVLLKVGRLEQVCLGSDT